MNHLFFRVVTPERADLLLRTPRWHDCFPITVVLPEPPNSQMVGKPETDNSSATIKGVLTCLESASPRCFNGGNVDFLHRHHRLESMF